MTLDPLVLYGNAFQTILVWVTFIKVHSQKGWWKILKKSKLDIFSDSVTTISLKLGTMAIYCKASYPIVVVVTFIQGHSHCGWLKILKNSNIDIFSDSLGQYSHETWRKGTLWLGLSRHTSFSDLDARSRSQGLFESFETEFSQTQWPLHSRNLTQRYAVARLFQPYQFL